ncbi:MULTISPECIES: hypothetical protein [Paenibacillus]|nr:MULTISPECIES: hypothetical protein [Paenibacillus]
MTEATISNDALRRHPAARETSGRPFTYSAAAIVSRIRFIMLILYPYD